MIRGKRAEEAVNILAFSNQKAARLFHKVLQSAISNAEENQGADIDELKVTSVYVNEGPRLKRLRARAKGRANRILKRTSHLTVVVGDE